jgi:hypothetical protein
VRIEAFAQNQRGRGAAELLQAVREDPNVLVLDPQKELRSFQVAQSVPMGNKRGRGRGAFIDSVLTLVDDFYEDTVQHLRTWSAKPPKMRMIEPPPDDVRPSLVSTAPSSQDGPEPATPTNGSRPEWQEARTVSDTSPGTSPEAAAIEGPPPPPWWR